MKLGKLSSDACEKIYSSWKDDNITIENLNSEENQLREEIISRYNNVRKDLRSGIPNGKLDKYQFDLLLGLELYEFFNDSIGFTMRQATDPDIWRNLTMKIAPDVVFFRWGKISSDRYYRRPTRIYFGSLWWYIHLSWSENKETTYEILKSNSTDEIMNLVERAGPMGYRVNFTRELMLNYSMRNNRSDRYLFRKLLKLNTARSIVLEPGLHKNGIVGYVEDLFKDVMKGELHEEASGGY